MLQERVSELRESESFILYSKYTCLLLQGEKVYLSSRDDHCTNITEKIVWNKGNQFSFICEAYKNRSYTGTCIVS